MRRDLSPHLLWHRGEPASIDGSSVGEAFLLRHQSGASLCSLARSADVSHDTIRRTLAPAEAVVRVSHRPDGGTQTAGNPGEQAARARSHARYGITMGPSERV